MEYGPVDDFLYRQEWESTFGEVIQEVQNYTNDSLFELVGYASKVFISDLGDIKADLIQLLGICLLFSCIHQLSQAYGKDQIEKYGYYIYFICGATICVNLFMQGYETVYATIQLVLQFMKLFLPCYSVAVIFSDGMRTSAAYYGLLLLVLFVAESIIFVFFLPATKIYMAVRFVNEGMEDGLFTKLVRVFEDGFFYGLKIMFVGICSINTLQSLLFPAMDKVKTVSVSKAIQTIPGIGSLAETASDVIISSSVLLKNSVGVAAIVVMIGLCAPSLIKLAALMIGIRLLEAIVDPFFGKKMGALLEMSYKSMRMLMKIQLHVFALFSISLVILMGFS